MLKIMFGYRDKRENISHYLGNPLYPMPTILLSSLTIHAPTWTEILDSCAFNHQNVPTWVAGSLLLMAERKDTARKYSDHSRYSSRGYFRKDALKNLRADEYRWFYRAIRGKSELRQVLRDITSRISCDLILFGHLQDCNLPAGEASAAWAGCTGDGSRRSHWTETEEREAVLCHGQPGQGALQSGQGVHTMTYLLLHTPMNVHYQSIHKGRWALNPSFSERGRTRLLVVIMYCFPSWKFQRLVLFDIYNITM